MGVYDYVRHEGKVYQTKDTPDQWLHEYRIVNGRLLGDEWHNERVPDAELPYPDMPFIGCVRTVIDKPDVDQNWHGYLYMIGEDLKDYRAKFTDGNLVEFICTERTDQIRGCE